MNRWGFVLLGLLAFLLGTVPARAQLPGGEPAMTVELVPEGRSIVPGGTVTLAFVMRPREGWHGYWSNPGLAGRPNEVTWRLPAGAAAGPLRYPVPERLLIAGIMNYVFERNYAMLVDLRVPAGAAPGSTVPVAARLDYLACTDQICVPQRTDVAIELRIGAPSAENRERIDGFRRALPRPLGQEARFEVRGGRLRIALPLPADVALDSPYFFPATLEALDYNAPQSVSRAGDVLIVETQAGPGAAGLRAIEGVLSLGGGRGLSLAARPGPVPATGVPLGEAQTAASGSAILLALLGALVGGLLLNVMPCVFPILSLKALSLARAGGGGERAARREAMAYAAGAVGICLLLGGAILGLRAGGVSVGWAFQLQDPRAILILFLLVAAIAFGLAGLFRLPAIAGGDRLAGQSGARGAFWTGALAAFVATPCTGPFMGAALGAALILPTLAALAVFAGLGLGLALPFLLLGFVPALRKRLPRPGPWMERFQRLLSVPMFLTAIGLLWVLGRQSGVDGMTAGLFAALALGLALWWAGRRGRFWPALAPAALAIGAALVLVRTVEPDEAAPGALGAQPFSEQRLGALRAEGRPVFVYFTADWCLTCKVNERAVLGRGDVAAALRAGNVAVLAGDWTRGDPEIGRFLERHGRSGVPLYLWYPPGREPETLPQILTPARVKELAS
ncbi:MAG TPA: thioredoxin family protein [Allosphingosinicella sp.]|jgi:DsbC/DsbD-like thiol-disulfide interchange protein/cytochrome c biogenesis protein CcdA